MFVYLTMGLLQGRVRALGSGREAQLHRRGEVIEIKVGFNVLFSGLLNDSVKPTASELEWFNEMGGKHNFDRIS